MAVTVYIPTPYRKFTNNAARVEVHEGDVLALVRELEARYPELRERILGPDGQVHGHLNIYVNDQPVEELQGMQTPLRDGDQVAVIPAMVGGTLAFTEEQIRRYSRHIILPEVGGMGQRKLLSSKVLLIGAGGLGSPAALYLAAAGVGTLGIVDFDVVDLSNLQRQILHHVHDVGRPKVQSAVETIGDLNPDVKVIPYNEPLNSGNVRQIFAEYDVIVNGCDNFPTRYLANDACVFLNKPMVDGSIFKFEGQVTVFVPGHGCYRCLYPSPPPPGLGAELFGGRGLRGAVRGHRFHPGDRDDQAAPGAGRVAGRPPAVLRCPGHGVPSGEDPPGRRLPGLRGSPDDHGPH